MSERRHPEEGTELGQDIGQFAMVPFWIVTSGAGPAAVMVWVCLAKHANQDRAAWPSIGSLAKTTGMSCDTVRRGLQRLKEIGAIEARPRFRADGSCTSNEYRLRFIHPDERGAPPLAKTVGAPSKNVRGPSQKREAPPLAKTAPLELDPVLELEPSYKRCVDPEINTPPLPPTGGTAGKEPLQGDLIPPDVPVNGKPAKPRTPKAIKGSDPANDEAWAAFDAAYPRPTNGRGLDRPEARRRFDRYAREGQDMDAIVEGARRYAAWITRMDKGEYVAMMSTWLNKKRWLETHDVNLSVGRPASRQETMRDTFKRLLGDQYKPDHDNGTY